MSAAESKSATPPEGATSGGRGAMIVLGATLGASTLLAVYLFAQYSAMLSYVRATIGYCAVLEDGSRSCVEPPTPPPWKRDALTPEQCVDETLAWARDCHGIKSMCDMYVEAVIRDCMASQDRAVYCEAIAPFAETTYFGATECRARGVRRDVDKEACANAYRSIGAWCEEELDARAAASQPAGAP
jgi:hypothetical protein